MPDFDMLGTRKTKALGHTSHKTVVLNGETLTADGVTEAVDLTNSLEALLFIHVTAATGTSPTLDFVVECSPDETNWYDHTTVTQITATGKTLIKLQNFGEYVRLRYTVAGTTPSFTVSATLVGKA